MNRLLSAACVVALAGGALGQTTTDAPSLPNQAVTVTFDGDLATVSEENQVILRETVTAFLKASFGTDEVATNLLSGSIVAASLVTNPTLNPTLTALTVEQLGITGGIFSEEVADDKLDNFWTGGWDFVGGDVNSESGGKGMGKGESGGKGMGKGEGGKGMGKGEGGKGMSKGGFDQLAWFRAGNDAAPAPRRVGKTGKVGQMRMDFAAFGTTWRDGEASGAAAIHGNNGAATVAAGIALVVGATLIGIKYRKGLLNNGGYEYIEATEDLASAAV